VCSTALPLVPLLASICNKELNADSSDYLPRPQRSPEPQTAPTSIASNRASFNADSSPKRQQRCPRPARCRTRPLRQSGRPIARFDPLLFVHRLEVYKSEGRILAQDDDGGESLNSRVQVALSANQTVYIRVSGVGGSTGSYRLRVTDVPTGRAAKPGAGIRSR